MPMHGVVLIIDMYAASTDEVAREQKSVSVDTMRYLREVTVHDSFPLPPF